MPRRTEGSSSTRRTVWIKVRVPSSWSAGAGPVGAEPDQQVVQIGGVRTDSDLQPDGFRLASQPCPGQGARRDPQLVAAGLHADLVEAPVGERAHQAPGAGVQVHELELDVR